MKKFKWDLKVTYSWWLFFGFVSKKWTCIAKFFAVREIFWRPQGACQKKHTANWCCKKFRESLPRIYSKYLRSSISWHSLSLHLRTLPLSFYEIKSSSIPGQLASAHLLSLSRRTAPLRLQPEAMKLTAQSWLWWNSSKWIWLAWLERKCQYLNLHRSQSGSCFSRLLSATPKELSSG